MNRSQQFVSAEHLPSTPPFHWKLRVYYEDTDAGGIVFYANYLKFFERARTEWLRAAGVGQQLLAQEQQTIFVVSETSLQYHASARLDDELRISVEVEKLGRASIHFLQNAWRGEQLLCSCKIRVGCVHNQSMRPQAIPSEVMQAIRQFHGPVS